MIRRQFLAAVIVLQLCTPAKAGWFGPSNYDECILESMKNVTSDVAAKQIMFACRRKFPANPKPDVASRELSPAETTLITGRAGLSYGNRFSGNLYNGNANVTISQVTIDIATSINGGEIQIKRYSVDVNIPPLTAKDFGFDIVVEGAGAKYDWNIDSAMGY